MTAFEAVEAALLPWLTQNDVPYAAAFYQPKDGALPDRFLVYDQISERHTSYDNRPHINTVRVQIDFVSRDVADMTSVPREIENELLRAKFSLADTGGRVAYNADSKHWYWQKDFYVRLRRD